MDGEMYRPDHASHTAATAHADDRVQFLAVGDETSLVELAAELALLPLCARGRVFVEVADPAGIVPLATPMRVTVTWLARSERGARPGTAAARAVRAWCDEMLCDGPGETRAILTGRPALAVAVRDHLIHTVGMAPAAVTA
jgi:NADPH-dependent ferric siderophore reductase